MNYMFFILKNCLLLFSKHALLFWHGSLMTQWVKAILLITQKFHLSSFLMLLIKTVLFTFCPTKKRLIAKDKDKDFDFMNVLLASENLKIIWKYDESLKDIMSFSQLLCFLKRFLSLIKYKKIPHSVHLT